MSGYRVPPELSCPLCLDLFYDPISTPCKHTYCRPCVARVITGGHMSCPLCRRSLQGFDPEAAAADEVAASLVANSAPAEELNRRSLEVMMCLEFVVGNLYEEVDYMGSNSNKWTMYVALRGEASQHASKLIEKVVYKLHSTFTPPEVTCSTPDLTLTRYGWGTFTVRCEIHWNPELGLSPTTARHYLVFDGEGGRTSAAVDVDPHCLARVCGCTLSRRSTDSLGGHSAPQTGEERNLSYEMFPAEQSRTPSRMARDGAEQSRTPRRTPSPPSRPEESTPRSRAPSDQAPSLMSTLSAALSSVIWPAQPSSVIFVKVGNQTEPDAGRFRWTTYVTLHLNGERLMLARRMIRHVVWELHPTFDPSIVTCRPPDFSLTRVGWGTFTVKCTIHWQDGLGVAPTRVNHMLNFDEDEPAEVEIAVDDDRLQSFL